MKVYSVNARVTEYTPIEGDIAWTNHKVSGVYANAEKAIDAAKHKIEELLQSDHMRVFKLVREYSNDMVPYSVEYLSVYETMSVSVWVYEWEVIE